MSKRKCLGTGQIPKCCFSAYHCPVNTVLSASHASIPPKVAFSHLTPTVEQPAMGFIDTSKQKVIPCLYKAPVVWDLQGIA